MYDPNKLHLGRFLLRIVNLNPLAIMLKMLRQPILDGQMPSLGTYALGASVAIIAATAAVLTLMRFERRMIFYL